jgi:hypothetical protein
MVYSVNDPLVAQPGRFVKSKFQEQVLASSSSSNGGPGNGAIASVVEQFAPYLNTPELKARVPSINEVSLQDIPSGTLVRYKGMVRDMLNPEYYAGAYRYPSGSWGTTKYEDFSSDSDFDLSQARETVMWERKPLFCVSVPGEAKWMQQQEQKSTSSPDQSGATTKRRMEMDTTAEEMETEEEESKSIKMNPPSDPSQAQTCCNTNNANVCMPCCNPNKKKAPPLPKSFNPNEGDFPCLLKVYETSSLGAAAGSEAAAAGAGLNSVKLSDVVEVVGILSSDPRLTVFESGQYQQGEEVTEEDIVNNPPASKVPRIHVIVGKRVDCYQNALEQLNTPFAKCLHNGTSSRPDFRQDPARLGALRERVICLLAEGLQGDKLAAEYLLLHLLSNTQREGGNHSQQLVGKHALNIHHKNSSEGEGGFVRDVTSCLEDLVPRCQSVAISLAKLNEKPLWPRKDYRVNRLLGGQSLLLADRTHLILDETRLTAGQLQAAGLLNFNCLKHLMTFQSIEVDFQFYKLPIHCNIPMLVLSEEKSLLPCDTDIKLQPSEGEQQKENNSLSADDLAELRFYLCSIQALEYSIPASVSDYLQQEFVQQRQKDPQSANAESFHRSLTLSRLVAQSFGEKELSLQHWRRLCGMEQARKQRQQQMAMN